MQVLDARTDTLQKLDLVRNTDGWRPAEEGQDRHAHAMWGPAPSGSMLRVTFEPDHTPVGPPCAPRAVEVLRFLAQHWSVPVGPLEAARPVR